MSQKPKRAASIPLQGGEFLDLAYNAPDGITLSLTDWRENGTVRRSWAEEIEVEHLISALQMLGIVVPALETL